jgi:8-oxo-dGTP pyrophosphatase MutT (NUDIX family)
MTESTLRPAATAILLRKRELPEVLMLRRSRKASFFPSAWVFPGGRVDDADHHAAHVGQCGASSAFGVAAIRECYEEAGVWLGGGSPSPAFRARLISGDATLGEGPGLVADLSRLSDWAWWITPEAEPRRYDTRFFLACLTDAEASLASHDDKETVDSVWITPEDAVERHERGDFFMAPPTYLILRELAGFDSLDGIVSRTGDRDMTPIMPIHIREEGRLGILLPGHEGHGDRVQRLECTSVHLGKDRWLLG